MNNNKTGKTALITGATKGIGYELTKLFAADSYDLVLVARNKDDLKELQKDLRKKHNINVTIIAKDLSVPNVALEIFRETIKKQIVIDVLVNNAGTLANVFNIMRTMTAH